jgi:hypothetical protein
MWIKQRTKKFENSLLTLERLDAICNLEGCTSTLITDQLKKYWKKILFVAMHDALQGTGIDEVYDEIKDIFDDADVTLRLQVIDMEWRLICHWYQYKSQRRPKISNTRIGILAYSLFWKLVLRIFLLVHLG